MAFSQYIATKRWLLGGVVDAAELLLTDGLEVPGVTIDAVSNPSDGVMRVDFSQPTRPVGSVNVTTAAGTRTVTGTSVNVAQFGGGNLVLLQDSAGPQGFFVFGHVVGAVAEHYRRRNVRNPRRCGRRVGHGIG